MTSDEIFCEENPHIMGLLFQNENLISSDNIRICGGLRIDTENGSIRGTSVFVLVRNEDEYSGIYTADVSYKYEDGIFKPYNIKFDKPGDSGGVPIEIWEICNNYLTDYWIFFAKTGSLDTDKYTSDQDAAELIAITKMMDNNFVSHGVDEMQVSFDSSNVEWGRSGDIIWVYIKNYEVYYLKNGEAVNLMNGYDSYFEFRETNGKPELLCEIELWQWRRELGIEGELTSLPLDIDAAAAVDKIMAGLGSSQDLEIITELGLPELIDKCSLWDMVFYSDAYIDGSALTNTVEIDSDPHYSEYRITDSSPEFIPKIEEATGIELEQSDGYYKCPFFTVEEMRSSAKRLFTDRYIENAYDGLEYVKEYNGSLYARLGGNGHPGGRIINARIRSMSDERVDFTAIFADGTTGVYSQGYTVKKEDGSWKLDEIWELPTAQPDIY